MSSSRSDRGRASAGKTRASKESGELRQKRRIMSPVGDPIWPEPTTRASESKNRASTRRNASLQRTSRNDPPGMRKSTARKGSVENETQRRARKASPKDEFTHGRDNIEQVRKTFFKGSGPDKARKSTSNVAKEKPVITTVTDDDPLQSPARAGRKSMIPARRDKDAKPLNRPDPEQMHGRVIQKVNYEAERKEAAAPVQKTDDGKEPVKRAQAKSDPGASEKKPREEAKGVPMSIRQSKTKQEEYPKVGPITRETKAKDGKADGENKAKSSEKQPAKGKEIGEAKREEEAPKVLTSKDRAALRVAQLAKLKQVDPDLGDALQRQSLIERIRGILAVQQEEESENEEDDAPQPRLGPPKPEALPTSKSATPKQESPSRAAAQKQDTVPSKSTMPKQESPSKPAVPKQEPSAKAATQKQEPPASKAATQKQEPPASKSANQKQDVAPSKGAAQKQDAVASKSAAPKQEPPVSKSTTPKGDAPPRPRVSFDLSNVSSDGRPTKRIFDMPDFLEGFDDDGMEPVEEKPFTEPTDFLKAYRFPTNYIIASMAEEEEEDEGEEDIDLMPRKAPPIPEPEPEPLPDQRETEEPTDDSVVSLTLVRQETPEKPRRAEFSPSKSPMDKFSESVSLDEFVKLETEMIEDEGEEEDEFDRICPNFTKLSSVVKQVLGDIAGPLVAEMALHKPEHFVFLISQDDQELEAIYLLKANLKEIAKLWGDGPDSITPDQVSAYWYFNAVSKQFEAAKKPGFRHNLDAVSL